jgi:L-lactate dehydrogenase complex protein LldE
VLFPDGQTCCGQPAYTSGYPEQARAVARRQIDLFPEPWPVVVLSGSCAAMMRHHYPKLFAEDPMLPKVRALAERIFELTEFLVHVMRFSHPDAEEKCSIALHTSCHARREMGVHETNLALLRGLTNVTVLQQDRIEECCGFGGIFSIRYPAISAAIAADKVESLRQTGSKKVVSADCGCLFNIIGRSGKLDQLAGNPTPSLTGEHIANFLWRRTAGTPS